MLYLDQVLHVLRITKYSRLKIKYQMKNAQCKKWLNKSNEKDIYTIQQFQYRKELPYTWTIEFFRSSEVDEWDSFCEKCIMNYSKNSFEAWKKDFKN